MLVRTASIALPFSGRLRGQTLKPGSYQAVFTARVGTATSTAEAVTFRIEGG